MLLDIARVTGGVLASGVDLSVTSFVSLGAPIISDQSGSGTPIDQDIYTLLDSLYSLCSSGTTYQFG